MQSLAASRKLITLMLEFSCIFNLQPCVSLVKNHFCWTVRKTHIKIFWKGLFFSPCPLLLFVIRFWKMMTFARVCVLARAPVQEKEKNTSIVWPSAVCIFYCRLLLSKFCVLFPCFFFSLPVPSSPPGSEMDGRGPTLQGPAAGFSWTSQQHMAGRAVVQRWSLHPLRIWEITRDVSEHVKCQDESRVYVVSKICNTIVSFQNINVFISTMRL